jgi:hypothetical protein
MNSLVFLLILSLLLPLQAGIMARSFGRNFWLWFFVALPLPVIGNYILLCLGDKAEVKLKQDGASHKAAVIKSARDFNRKPARLAANA